MIGRTIVVKSSRLYASVPTSFLGVDTVAGIMTKAAAVHEDSLDSLLDRIGILREGLISVERSLERMKSAQKQTKKSGQQSRAS